MTEIEKLIRVRDKLIARRRALVASLQEVAPEQLTGDAIERIQTAIEAATRAIDDERRTEPATGMTRRAVSMS